MKNLALQSILGIVNLMVIIGLLLFGSARSLAFIQAWVYLIIFLGSVSYITVYIYKHDKSLLKSRIKVGATDEKRTFQKIIQTFASFAFIGMFLISGFDYRYHWSKLPDGWWMIFAVFLAITMVLFFIVFRKNTFLSATIEIQNQQTVISDGPYAIVRHPMYAIALLYFIFTPLSLASLWGLVVLPIIGIMLVLRCLDEEVLLRKELEGYSDYCKKVKYRLIPFIW